MLNPKGFLEKDLDQAVRLYDWFKVYIGQANILMDKGQLFEARRELERMIKITHSLELLKKDKLLFDLKRAVDQQVIVENVLRSRR